jgi:hypothetical protein
MECWNAGIVESWVVASPPACKPTGWKRAHRANGSERAMV